MQGIYGLCVVTKTNAWKTVRCECVERRRWRNVCDQFLLEVRLKLVDECSSVRRMEGVRNVLKVSESSNSVRENAY